MKNRASKGAVVAGFLAALACPSFAADPVPAARAHFLKLLERPRVAANVQLQPPTVANGLSEIAFSYDAEKGQKVPGILVLPAKMEGKHPVVIALHGTGGKKEGELPLLRNLAGRGFIGVAIDGRYHGARAAGVPLEPGMNAYESAIYRAWSQPEPHEHPFFFDMAWDVMRLNDYLETRADVDAGRIGIYGVSKGGIEAYLSAAADTRIAAAVPCISVESFQWAAENNSWQPRMGTVQKVFDRAMKDAGVTTADGKFVSTFYSHIAPGIDSEFDGPSLVPLIAPRPLMAINGALDPRTPTVGLKITTDAIQAAYHAAKADDHFNLLIQPNTAHQVRPESEQAGVEFLVKWLKP